MFKAFLCPCNWDDSIQSSNRAEAPRLEDVMRFRGLDKATLEELQAIGKCDICGAPATTHVRAEFHEDLGDGPMKKKACQLGAALLRCSLAAADGN